MKANETAMILIEFQHEFCSPGGKLHELVQGEMVRNQTLANAEYLLTRGREKGCLIIHCPFILNEEWVQEHACRGILAGILENRMFAPSTWGQMIVDEVAPKESDLLLVNKSMLSAFSHTDLQEILQKNGIRNLIVAGFLTNVCAQATAMSAYDLGYQTCMALDACGAATESIQKYVEENIPALLGTPWKVREILEEIS
ncbi:MAG: cysteine hydrolase [Planctomycetia bacterium]|nr:cysteine hydrolase [Planctomycetia bacterium]